MLVLRQLGTKSAFCTRKQLERQPAVRERHAMRRRHHSLQQGESTVQLLFADPTSTVAGQIVFPVGWRPELGGGHHNEGAQCQGRIAQTRWVRLFCGGFAEMMS